MTISITAGPKLRFARVFRGFVPSEGIRCGSSADPVSSRQIGVGTVLHLYDPT